MIRSFRFAVVAMLALASFSQLSCKLNDYCLECGKADGGSGGSNDAADAPIDSPPDSGTCVPTGDETCDGKDNDCDGLVDEGVLPEVGDLCANQNGECAGGTKICAPTFHCSTTVAQACADASATTCPQGETCKADGKSTDHIACSKNPQPESCDGKDNNCNGTIDEGDPNGGGRCGNGTGTCVQGVLHCTGSCVNMPDSCVGGTVDSVTCEGGVGPATEVCDGLDNNCDGFIDNGVPTGGTCGTSNVGACKQGIIACIGGGTVCSGHCSATTSQPCGSGLPACPGSETCVTPVNPTLETCNGADDDCDGSTDEDFKGGHCSTTTTQACGAGLPACPGSQTCVGNSTFDLSPQNCGACGTVCGSGLPNSGNATWACSGSGTCVIASCKSGYHDNDGNPANGCEFGVCFNSGPEVCDGVDNDCDGVIDETGSIGAAPAICATLGECKGTVASCPCKDTPDTNCTNGGTCVTSCSNTGGWECNYPSTVTVVNGVIQAETKCDNLDNDCNGIIDDNQVQMAHADCGGYTPGNASSCPATPVTCSNGQQGACARGGTYQCGTDLNGPAVCNAVDGSSSKVAETCNNTDDDCDGVTDEGAGAGGLSGQTWIEIGGGHQMMQYEASRPDAASTNAASVATCTGNTLGAQTTIASGSNAMTLPQGTINVANTLGFTTSLTITVVTSAGTQNVTCTGLTATTFTGCSGGTGTMSTGGAVGQLTVSESGTTGTYNTTVPHGLVVGERVIISGVGVAGYNGTFFVATVPSATSFTITGLPSSLSPSGGGIVSSHCPLTLSGVTETGYNATFTTTSAHGLTAGTAVIISGVSVNSYNGTWVILSTTSTTFTVQLTVSGLGAGSGGTVATNGISTCSQAGVQPWTDVTYPQALAACQAVGGTLCSDSEWHRACSANGSSGNNRPTVYPVSTGGAGLLIEAEDYFMASYGIDSSGNIKSWVEDDTPGYFGISDMLAQPNTGITISSGNAPTQSPRLDYQINFTATSANYHACVHMFSPGHCSADATKACSVDGDCTTGTCVSADNQVYVGLSSSLPGTVTGTLQTTANNTWQWIQSPALNVAATGSQFLSLYMATDGAKVDAIYVINGTCPGTLTNSSEAGVVDSPGFKWAMQPATTPPNNYTSGNCNDQNNSAGAPVNSGSMANCYASDDGLKSGTTGVKAFDMSGNVREWTFAHQPGQNPVRGGAYNDTSQGISCPNNFLLADDKFLLPNVGFRCCR